MQSKSNEQVISIRQKQTLKEGLQSWFLLIVFAAMVVLFYGLNPRIFSTRSIATILATAAFSGIISIGLITVMTTGVFDMSCGMKAALAGSIVGWICKDGCTPQLLTIAIIVALLASALVGFAHAFLNVVIGIPGFISALAMRMLLQGVITLFTQNSKFYSMEWGDTFKVLGQTSIGFIPLPFLLFIIVAVLSWVFLERTKTGRHIYATGSNATAAKQVGIRVNRMRYFAMIIGAVIAGIGGILFSSRNYYTSVDIGLSLQSPALTCCLLSATVFQPGKYNVPGCVLSALFISVLTTGIFSVVVSSAWLNQVLQGTTFLLALLFIAKTKEGGLSKVTFDL